MEKKSTTIVCPNCGVELEVSVKNVSPKASSRLEALKAAGVNVDNLFAIVGANGGEYVGKMDGGILRVLDDNDPLFAGIVKGGSVPNSRLFRRWVMGMMFQMIEQEQRYEGRVSLTKAIKRLGYEYQWKMIVNEMHAQYKMYRKDEENFFFRNIWFNKALVVDMAADYIEKLKKLFESLPERHCKRVPYKRIAGNNIFVHDFYNDKVKRLVGLLGSIERANSPKQLHDTLVAFNKQRIKLNGYDVKQHKQWVDAYKGCGCYYTMQNLIRFHGCFLKDQTSGKLLAKEESLNELGMLAERYTCREGYRMFGVLQEMLEYNGIDVTKKMKEWRK